MSIDDPRSRSTPVPPEPVPTALPSARRLRWPQMRVPHSLVRRGGGALAGTALAAGLVVGAGAPAHASARAHVTTPSVHADSATGVDGQVQRRRDGVAADLARAVASGDVTQEQADAFFARMQRHIA